MQRKGKEWFLNKKPNPDNVIGVSVHDNKWYFLGWMEDAENYRMQLPKSEIGLLIDKNLVKKEGIVSAINQIDAYNSLVYGYLLDNPDGFKKCNKDEYEAFYGVIRPNYIYLISDYESLCDEKLEDGSYIFIKKDENDYETL